VLAVLAVGVFVISSSWSLGLFCCQPRMQPMDVHVDFASDDTEPADTALLMPGPGNRQKRKENRKEAIQHLDMYVMYLCLHTSTPPQC